jgi:hypothetical protein
MKHENFGLKIIWPKIAHPAQRLSSVLKFKATSGEAAHAADGTRPVPTRSCRANAGRQQSRQQQEHHIHSQRR